MWTAPLGGIPHGWELPNHACDEDEHNCNYVVRYNNIFDAEGCCQACTNLEFLDHQDIGGDVSQTDNGQYENPCVAWQVVDGICHIMRKQG